MYQYLISVSSTSEYQEGTYYSMVNGGTLCKCMPWGLIMKYINEKNNGCASEENQYSDKVITNR